MIKELTSLRFVFMCMIFLHHMGYYPQGGYIGVAFFFILSGFVLTLGYKDRIINRQQTSSQFITRRLIRLYPLHWLCLVAALILDVLMGINPFQSTSRFFANLLLLQSWIPDSSYYYSYNGVSWFLSDVLFFSILFPLLLKALLWIKKSSYRIFLLIIGVLIIIPSLLYIITPDDKAYYLFKIFPPARLVEFVLGMCTALLYLDIQDKENWINKYKAALRLTMYSCIPLLIILAFCIPQKDLIFSLFFAPLICVLLLLISLKPIGENTIFSWSPLVLFGEFSFEFYLVHQLCFKFAEHYNFWGISESLVVLIVVFFITALLSVLCRYAFVKPITKWLNSILR